MNLAPNLRAVLTATLGGRMENGGPMEDNLETIIGEVRRLTVHRSEIMQTLAGAAACAPD